MIILFWLSFALLSMVFFVALFNFFTAPRIARTLPLKSTPKVSVLIPARNEAKNIGRCLTGLQRQNYPDFEIIVLNDHSTDETAEIVQFYAKSDRRIKRMHGEKLPDGWFGKNWACHQLSKAASGDILIFTDADNHHAPFAVRNSVAWMQKLNLGLLSAFPQQKTVTLVEKLVVPVMDLFVYGTLPLWATYFARHYSLSAANGQWLAFTRESYDTLNGHQAVKNELVEDTELSRLAKRMGIKTLTAAGTNAVFCRMYHNADEVWNGFSKNFYGLTGYNNAAFFSVITSMVLAFILPYVLWIFPAVRELFLLLIAMNIAIRTLISLKYKHPFWVSVLLHPVAMGYALVIGLNSFYHIRKGTIQWKGREIKLSSE